VKGFAMPPISYNPTNFQWQDWTDNVGRVQAGGDNGFNARFQALQAEFPRVADVVALLAGPAGRAFTGAPVTMDQGWTAR